MNTDDKSKKALRGVRCDAMNCEYNTGNGECHAKQISIGPVYADACTDTVCASFLCRRDIDRGDGIGADISQ